MRTSLLPTAGLACAAALLIASCAPADPRADQADDGVGSGSSAPAGVPAGTSEADSAMRVTDTPTPSNPYTTRILRAAQIFELLLGEGETGVEDASVEKRQGEAVLVQWSRQMPVPLTQDETAEACAELLADLPEQVHPRTMAATGFVRADPPLGAGEQAAALQPVVTIGIDSHNVLSEVGPVWEEAAEVCDGVEAESEHGPRRLEAFHHDPAVGLRVITEREAGTTETVMAGFDYGHNTVTFYVTETGPGFVEELVDAQFTKLEEGLNR